MVTCRLEELYLLYILLCCLQINECISTCYTDFLQLKSCCALYLDWPTFLIALHSLVADSWQIIVKKALLIICVMLMTRCVNDNDCTQLCVNTMWNNMSL